MNGTRSAEPLERPYRITTFERIDEIGRAEWESLHIPSCYLSFDWLRSVEPATSSNARYVTVADAGSGRLLAATPCYVLRSTSIRTHYNVVNIACGALAVAELTRPGSEPLHREHRLAAAELQAKAQSLFPVLLVGSSEGYAGGALLRRALGAETLHEVASMLHDGVVNLAAVEQCRLAAFLYVARSDPLATVACHSGAIELAIEPRGVLSMAWPDFEGYLGVLSRSRRRTVRGDLRRFHGCGLSASVAALTDLDSELLGRLSRNLHEKYNGRGDGSIGFDSYIDRLKELPLPAFAYVATREDVVVGFTAAFRYRDGLFPRIGGFDYGHLGRDSCYFNVAYYAPIAHALELGLDAIDYGIGTVEAKLARGCDLIPQYGYVLPIEVANGTRRALQRAARCVTLAKENVWRELRELFPNIA